MNRRKMLAISAGLAFSGIPAALVEAQESPVKAQGLPLWFIHEDELKTGVVSPITGKRNKAITTNRFEGRSTLHDKLIIKAEAIYPFYNSGFETERGKPLWYSEGSYRVPFNITTRAVNYYFQLAAQDKYSNVVYNVAVTELTSVQKKSSDEKEFDEKPNIYEVSLAFSHRRYVSSLGMESFGLQKRVIFDRNEEVIALYMPPKPTVYVS